MSLVVWREIEWLLSPMLTHLAGTGAALQRHPPGSVPTFGHGPVRKVAVALSSCPNVGTDPRGLA
jgi:hypothetical protein